MTCHLPRGSVVTLGRAGKFDSNQFDRRHMLSAFPLLGSSGSAGYQVSIAVLDLEPDRVRYFTAIAERKFSDFGGSVVECFA